MKKEENGHPHELISAHLDRCASEPEEARLQQHLQGCAECRQVLHDLGRIRSAVGEEPVPTPPLHLRERILGQIRAGTPRRTPVLKTDFWRSPFPFAAAATVLLGATLFFALRRETVSSLPALPEPLAAAKASPATSQPAPPPSPAKQDASTPKREAKQKAVDRDLKALGYAGNAASQPPGEIPAAPSADVALAPEERQESARKESELLDKVISSGLTREQFKKSEATPRQPAGLLTPAARAKDGAQDLNVSGRSSALAAAPNPVTAAAGPRSLAYDGPDFSATFGEDGLITLVARGYACSVSVPVTAAPPSPQPTGPKTASIQDLQSLLSAASSREFLSVTSPARGDSGVVVGEGSSLVLRDAGGDPIHAVQFREPWAEAPPVLGQIRRGMKSLLQERYRKDLESRCGPIPEKIFASP